MDSGSRQRLLDHALAGDLAAAAELERLARRTGDDEALAVALCVVDPVRQVTDHELEAIRNIDPVDGLDEWHGLEARWTTICELALAGRAGDLDRLRGLLDRFWPPRARTLPSDWLFADDEPPEACVALVRKMQLFVFDPETLERSSALLSMPSVSELVEIEVAQCCTDASDTHRLCELIGGATRLERLYLSNLELDERGLDALLAVTRLPSLEILCLDEVWTELPEGVWSRWLSALDAPQLRALRIAHDARPDLLALYDNPRMRSLERVRCASLDLGGLWTLRRVLGSGQRHVELAHLTINWPLDKAAFDLLARADDQGLAIDLDTLTCYCTSLSTARGRALVERKDVANARRWSFVGDAPSLYEYDLFYSFPSDPRPRDHFTWVFELSRCTRLTTLELRSCEGYGPVEIAGLFDLDWPGCKLTTLILIGMRLSDSVLETITSKPWASNLRGLGLGDNPFSDAALVALAHSGHLPHLEWLDLSPLEPGEDAMAALQAWCERQPGLRIELGAPGTRRTLTASR